MTRVSLRIWDGAELSEGAHDGTGLLDGRLVMTAASGIRAYADPHSVTPAADAEAQPETAEHVYAAATWTSPVVTSGGPPFTELVASWNAETPAGTWIEVSVAVTGHSADGVSRSSTYVLGRWAEDVDTICRTSVPGQGDELAGVDTDVVSARPGVELTAWQLVVSLMCDRGVDPDVTPSVRLLAAMTSSPEQQPVSTVGGDTARGTSLDVPTYSQQLHRGTHPEYNGGGEAWCSAASVAMLLAYWQRRDQQHGPQQSACADFPGADPQVVHAAAGTYDWSYGGTGNWTFTTAYAGRYGLRAFVTRLHSLSDANRFLAAGIPLVASVSFDQHQLDGAGYDTRGHLLVIVGFTESGDVIVNDPASHLLASNDDVRTVYDRDQFERAWSEGSARIVYVIHPPGVPPPASPPDPAW